MLKLYDDELCGECYKARLMLGLLDVAYERSRVELYPSKQNGTPRFLALNPLGTLPVLEADGVLVRGAHAILVYLARRYGANDRAHWLSVDDPLRLAQVQSWLDFAAQLSAQVLPLRARVLHGEPQPGDPSAQAAKRLLRVLDETCWFNEAAGSPFVCATPRPSVADIACFVPAALLDEAQIESIDYPALARWISRIKRLDGFTTMAGVYAAL